MEAVDGDEEDRGRIWEIEIDTWIFCRKSAESISRYITSCAKSGCKGLEHTGCEEVYSVLLEQRG